MIVLHVSRTPMVGVPAFLTKLMNRYMRGVEAYCLAPGSYGNKRQMETAPTPPKDIIKRADVVVIHNSVPAALAPQLWEKRCVRMIHSQPHGLKNTPTSLWNIPFGVVAQYQPRLYTGDFLLLPNLIDLDDEWFAVPWERPGPPYLVGFFPSHTDEHPAGDPLWWNNKGVKETIAAVKESGKLKLVHGTNLDFWECIAQRKPCHIVVDECFTGSYHRTSLEAATMGQIAVNAADEKSLACLMKVAFGHPETYPFEVVKLADLPEFFRSVASWPEAKVAQRGMEARLWMRKHWHPKDLLETAYRPLLDRATVPSTVGSLARP